MPKNLQSTKFEHSTRNNLIWSLLKKYPKGITRQQLTIESGYQINEACSAVGHFINQGLIAVVGQEVNPASGLKVELIAIAHEWTGPSKSRKGELKRLRARVAELEKNQTLLIEKLKALISENSK